MSFTVRQKPSLSALRLLMLLVLRLCCVQVPLARSETHLSELLEEVCKSMSDYALHLDPDTQQKQYRRFAPRSTGTDGGFPDLKNFQFDGPEASTGLAFAVCSRLDD